MKKQLFYSSLALFSMILTVGMAHAQQRGDDSNRPSKNAEAKGMIGDTEIRITYGAPHVNGREIFGKLEPYGKVWRAGANEATTVTFSTNVKVNGQDLAAGTYSFFMLPTEEGPWDVIFNTEANQWGAFNYDASKDALRVKAEPVEAEHQEILSIEVDGGDSEGAIVLRWAMTQIAVNVTPN